MPRFTLRLTRPGTIAPQEAQSSFYWLTDGTSSFTTGLDPNLSSLGPVPALNIDLVRIAVAVFAADRSTYRSARGSNWNQRQLEIEVPVSDVDRWGEVSGELQGLLGFLTGDQWSVTFNDEAIQSPTPAEASDKPQRVVLLSGGADSAIGALVSRSQLAEGESHVLVSHVSFTPHAPIQREIATAIERLIPGPSQTHLQIQLSRNERCLDGTKYHSEPSSRSRSLLFLSLGLAVASVHQVPLWIPENGFASLNPPLGPDRRGALSTHTTHPAFLEGLGDLLNAVGARGTIENPFADSTKGEMFQRAAGLAGANQASAFLSATNSCSHTGQRAFRISPTQPCGVCFGCVVRRAAFSASGLKDGTSYMSANGNTRVQDWLDNNSVLPAVQSFLRRGVRPHDLIAISLPATYSTADALDLCTRAVAELAGLVP